MPRTKSIPHLALVLLLALFPIAPARSDTTPAGGAPGDNAAAPGTPSAAEDEDRSHRDLEHSPATRSRHRAGDFAMFSHVQVASGEVHRGDLVSVLGDVRVDGEVTGDVVVIGGNVRVSGSVGGDLVGIFSRISLEREGDVRRDVVNVLGHLDNAGATGNRVVDIPLIGVPAGWKAPFGMIGSLIAWMGILWTIMTFLLLLLVAGFASDRVRTLSAEAPVSYLWAFLAGLGGYVALWVINVILFVTVVGIPLALVVYAAFIVLKWAGVAGIYHFVGRSVGRLLGRELSLLPAILVGFLPFALLHLLPLLAGGAGILFAVAFRLAFWVFVEIPAVGLVILTRVGSRSGAATLAPPPTVRSGDSATVDATVTPAP